MGILQCSNIEKNRSLSCWWLQKIEPIDVENHPIFPISCITTRCLLDFSSPKVHPSSLRVESFITPEKNHPSGKKHGSVWIRCHDFPFILVSIPENKHLFENSSSTWISTMVPRKTQRNFNSMLTTCNQKKKYTYAISWWGGPFSLETLASFSVCKKTGSQGCLSCRLRCSSFKENQRIFTRSQRRPFRVSMLFFQYVPFEVCWSLLTWYTPWKQLGILWACKRVYYVKPSHLFFIQINKRTTFSDVLIKNQEFAPFIASFQVDTS